MIQPLPITTNTSEQLAEIDPRWQGARRILAVRLDNLGDVLVTSPALHAINTSLPEASLTLLASPVGAQVGRLIPDVDDVIIYDAPWMDAWGKLSQDAARELALIAEMTERRFDAAMIFTSFRQSPLPAAYLCYLAGIPLRLGATFDGAGSLLTTRLKRPESLVHEVERGLDLVAAVGLTGAPDDPHDLRLRVPNEAREEAQKLLSQSGATGRPLVVVHPGCSMPARTYPWEQYADVVAGLVMWLGATVALTGAESERELVGRILARLKALLPASELAHVEPLAGRMSFPALCALIEQADLTITNNTGPMHFAAAVKTPVVALFALTNPPEQWGPWRVAHRLLNHEVACHPCYSRICPYSHECLRLVTPEMVVDAASELLNEAKGDAA